MNKRYAMTLAAPLLWAAATAAQAQAPAELKIGVMAVLSGPGQPWGIALQRAAEMAAEDANGKDGILVGGKRHTVKLVSYDTKYRPDEALSVINRLIFQDQVKFVMGPIGSAEAFASQEISTANKVITFTNGWSPRVLGPKVSYQFRMTPSTDEFATPLIRWIGAQLKLKKIGGLFPNDEYGQQAAKQVKTIYDSIGTATTVEMFERNRVDFVPLITRLMNQGIDAIDLDGNAPATSGLIVKQARGLGFKGPIVRSGGPAEEEILQVAGKEASEGIYLYSPVGTDPTMTAFAERYRKKYGAEMNSFTPAFYDSARMLLAGIEKAGTVTDTDAVARAIESLRDFAGVQGKLNWTGKAAYGLDRQVDAQFYVVQLRNGKKVPMARCNYTQCGALE